MGDAVIEVLQCNSGQQSYIADFALALLGKVGIPVGEADRQLFFGCKSIEDIMFRLSESGTIEKLFLAGTGTGLGRLGEFYIALRCEARWETRPGYDVWGAFEYARSIEAGKIEVKTSKPSSNRDHWYPRISGYEKKLRMDVLAFLGMKDSFNPCEASLFIIPKKSLIDVANKWWNDEKKRDDPRPRIAISKNRFNLRTGHLNSWHEYQVSNHSKSREIIAMYTAGDFRIISDDCYQLPLL